MRSILYSLTFILLLSCDLPKQAKKLADGKWRGEIKMQGQILPFNFEVVSQADSQAIFLINGEERLPISHLKYNQDSVKIGMLFYDCEIVGKTDGKTFEGEYVKRFPDKEYRLPITAIWGKNNRFETSVSTNNVNFANKWSVSFIEENGDSTQAVGIFTQEKEELRGTFLTTTGDYRFLAGNVEGRQLNLSCFDGEHAFLFKATQVDENTLEGTFWSGSAYKATWIARKNPNAALPNPDSLTYLKEGHERLNFSFPDLKGNQISLEDEKYKGKVVLVQLLGSWCPNCMDETVFLAKYHQANKEKPLAIIGLAYERNPDFNEAKKRLEKMKTRFEIGYDILVAGTYQKAAAAASLPMLNHVMAFPTTIFIDKKGRVRKIHTGFNGPGTGDYYEKFVEEFNVFMDKLLAEENETIENKPQK